MHLNTDIDECAGGTDGCAHICINEVGSYTCSCNLGYRIERDGHKCEGTYPNPNTLHE